ncbi:hypothetical protein Ahy_B01g052612 [Arachis hypogaea]|uniref:Protein FAR1-RELATED SEQUENCE n=1 Tax=Arachis hypogaea TaxID=3818 RepID=A0A445APW5_ARAHY|nr:hypothetical protein Ahy_B01g052612 [Arachis hypogaea]
MNCPARIYVHILKDVGLWRIFKVVLNHSHPYCPYRAEMLKQHRELSIFVCRTIENNEKARIRPIIHSNSGQSSKTKFYRKDMRNYITRKVRNISEQDDAKEFGNTVLEAISGFQLTEVLFELFDVVAFSGINFVSFVRLISSYLDSSLSRSPVLDWDEKHITEREHACLF